MNKAMKALWISIAVSLVVTLLIILLPNSINNYYADSSIFDVGAGYYEWKFRPGDVNIVARVTAWLFFALHLGSVYYLLYKLKQDKPKDGISKYNYYLLFTNLYFIFLHYIHTWVWYDALAQDTPVWSSQGSVIVMLVLILIMENGRRGLFFGKKVNLPKASVSKVMKYHGAFIAAAIIFTFWYHPMEFTYGHLFGFFYMFMLFIQMSLARTKVHNNKYWKIVLEVMVLFHGTFVAVESNNAPWAMFLFGFAAIFFITQIYGLGLKKRTILISQIIFTIAVLLIYSGLFTDYTFVDVNEVFRIPIIEYGLVFVFVYIIYLPIWINRKFTIPTWVNKTAASILIILLVLSGIWIIYTNSPYYADPLMYDSIDLNANISFEETNDAIFYVPDVYEANIIIIPGGKVDASSYMYLASELANNGYKVTIVKPMFNLAILESNQALDYLDESKPNILIGHSLGGAVASGLVEDHDIEYLILLGSYNLDAITETKVLSITAENDLILDPDTYQEKTALIENFTEYEIQGGNHGYFGFYGEQYKDGEASISNKVQQDFIVTAILAYLDTH